MIRLDISKATDAFEHRFILSTLIAGCAEVTLALTPAGKWLGSHFNTFGYLGVGLIILSLAHFTLKALDRRKKQ